MPTPPPEKGSTGSFPKPEQAHGSSFIELLKVAAEEAPTVIRKPATACPETGQVLGHFEILGAIGSGGMATVLQARDLELGRVVALKILPPESAKDPETVTRFKQEARAAAKLDHDNVARVYFCGEDRGLHFIAFEFVEGENLRQRIDRLGPVTAEDAVRFLIQLSAGLAHAAERGVVHRDIKPSNILITPTGKAKIVDMGLARHRESHSINGGVTQSGVTLGTFDYISPEQALDPRRADVRSDLYSLGCAFYHALTGRPPVPEGTAAKKLYAHQHEPPPDPRDLNPAVPDGLAVVLGKMMAKDPDRRYQTPAELTRDLMALARAWGVSTEGLPDVSGVYAVPGAVRGVPRVPVGLAAAVSAVAVVIAVYAGMGGGAGAPKSATLPWTDPDPRPAGRGAAVAEAPPPATTPTVPATGVAADAKGFAAAVRAGEPVIKLLPGVVYDLTTSTDLVFTGPTLTLEPESAGAVPPVLKFAAEPSGGLSVRGAADVLVRGVTLQIHEPGEATEGEPVGVLFADCKKVVFDGVRVRGDGGRVVGVAVTAAAAASFTLHHALFDLGPQAVGVKLTGPITADVKHLAAGPHDAVFALRTAAGQPPPEARFRECSFLMDRGSAAADAAGGAKVAAGFCVFAAASAPGTDAAMPGAVMTDARPAVLRLADPGGGSYTGTPGEPNLYFRTDAAAIADRRVSPTELDPAAQDPAAVVRDKSPWESDNPKARLADADRPELAFKLNLKDSKVFAPRGSVGVLGAKDVRRDRDRIYASSTWPPQKPTPAVAAKQRVVWPDADGNDPAGGVYADFAAAFADLKPGETLLVHHTGPVPVRNLSEKTGLRAEIRAYPGFAPELVPAEETRRRDASLFQLTDGEMTFDGLTFQLGGRQSLVAVGGGRKLVFRHCVITVDEKDPDPQAAVAVLDQSREMPARPAADAPSVRFENTLVRGRGRAVWVQAARTLDVIAENTAFALEGPVFAVDPAGRDTAVLSSGVRVTLTRVTALLGGPVIELRANREPGRGLPASVTADKCLFAALSPASPKPLAVVDDADPTADPRGYLNWQARGPNLFANFSRLTAAAEFRPADGAGAGTEWTLDKFLDSTRDTGRATAVKFAGGAVRGKLPALRPLDLKATFSPSDPDAGSGVDAGAAVEEWK